MKRKVMIAESLKEVRKGRERSGNYGCIEKMWKRKRKESMKEEKEEDTDIFNKSRKTHRTPKKGTERGDGAKGGLKKEDTKKWKKEMEEVIKEVMKTGLKEWKEEMKLMKKEMKEGIDYIRKEMKEIREREDRWREERK